MDRGADAHTFRYWSLIIELGLIMCRFVRYLREDEFDVQVLDEPCPWFFAFDHTNYAQCMSANPLEGFDRTARQLP